MSKFVCQLGDSKSNSTVYKQRKDWMACFFSICYVLCKCTYWILLPNEYVIWKNQQWHNYIHIKPELTHILKFLTKNKIIFLFLLWIEYWIELINHLFILFLLTTIKITVVLSITCNNGYDQAIFINKLQITLEMRRIYVTSSISM